MATKISAKCSPHLLNISTALSFLYIILIWMWMWMWMWMRVYICDLTCKHRIRICLHNFEWIESNMRINFVDSYCYFDCNYTSLTFIEIHKFYLGCQHFCLFAYSSDGIRLNDTIRYKPQYLYGNVRGLWNVPKIQAANISRSSQCQRKEKKWQTTTTTKKYATIS